MYRKVSIFKNPFTLCNQNVGERPEIEEQPVKSEPSRDLAQLHHICVTHLAELTTKAKTQVSLGVINLKETFQITKAKNEEALQGISSIVAAFTLKYDYVNICK